MLSWIDVSRVKVAARRRDLCVCAYPANNLMMLSACTPVVLLLKVGVVPGTGVIGSGVDSGGCFRCQLGGGAPVPLYLLHVCELFGVMFWQRRHLGVWLWWSIATCLSIPAFTSTFPGSSTLCFLSSRTSGCGVLMRYCVSSMLARKNPLLAVLAMFKTRRM